MKRWSSVVVTVGLVALAQSASAQRMFVRDPSQYLGYGYGNFSWTTFTAMWNAKFGAVNIDEGNSIGSLAGYTSLLLDANQPGTSAFNLTPTEASTVQSFLSGGGRLYAFGENDAWSSWNSNIMALFGAAASGTGLDVGTPVVANNLTAGVSSIDTPAPGFITNFNGGTNLFTNAITGLFDSDNAIVVLDINICDDTHISQADNRRFCQNIVDFTAGGPVVGNVTPEPASLVLLGTGFLGLGGVAYRRRRRADEQ